MPLPITMPAAKPSIQAGPPVPASPMLSKMPMPAKPAPQMSAKPAAQAPIKSPMASKPVPGQAAASSGSKTAALRLMLKGVSKDASDKTGMAKRANRAQLKSMLKQASLKAILKQAALKKHAFWPALIAGTAATAVGVPLVKRLYHALTDAPYGDMRSGPQDKLFQNHLRSEAMRVGKQRNDLANIRGVYAQGQPIQTLQ